LSYNKVKIRRGSGEPDTNDVSAYELAYDYTNNKLWIHDGDSSSMVEITGSTVSTAAVSNGASTLATGDQIYDFVVGQNYLTSVPNHSANLLTSGTVPLARISDLTTDNIASDAAIEASKIGVLPASKITSGTFADARIAASNVTQHLDLGSGNLHIKKTGGNNTNNYAAVEVYSAGTAENQAAIAIQQQTSEGDTIIFADFEPYVEWGISADNSADEIHFTGGSSTGSLGIKTFKNNAGSNRTAYKKMSVGLSSGNVSVGGTLTAGGFTTTGTSALAAQTWDGHITWNTGKNIYVAGESSFDVSGSGIWQVWDSGDGTHAIKMDVGQQVEIGNAGSRGLRVHGKCVTANNSGYVQYDNAGNQATVVNQDTSDILFIGDTTHTEQIKIQTAHSTGNGGLFLSNDGNVSISGNLSLSSPMSCNYGVTINEGGNDSDTRIEGNSDANLVRVDAGNDRVGIGTASPSSRLHISEETSTTGTTGTTLLTLTNDVGSDLSQQKTFVDFTLLDSNANETPQVRIGAEVGHNGDANTQQKEGSGAFVVYTNNADTTSGDAGASLAERMRVDYQGRVGIGTSSPETPLHVNQDSNDHAFKVTGGGGGASIARFVRDVGVSSPYAEVNIHAGSGDPQITFRDVGNKYFSIGIDDSANAFKISDNSGVGTNDRLTIDTSGNVGIGTSSPATVLHIDKSQMNPSSTSALPIVRIAGSYGGGLGFLDTKESGIYQVDNGDTWNFYCGRTIGSDTALSKVALTMKSDGRVGIGTTAPGSLLTVRKDGTQVSSPSTSYQIMTVSNSNGGIAIQAGASSDAFISFGDPGQYDAGRIRYHNSTHYMDFCTGGNNPRMTLKNDGKIVVNGTDSDGMFRVNSTSSENAVKIYANAARGASRYALMIDDNDTNGRGSVYVENASGTGMKIVTQGSNYLMDLVSNNDGSNPARSCGVRMTSYEGRANGHYHHDANYGGEWFSGNRYAGNMTNWHVGYRSGTSGDTPDYLSRARIMVDTSGNFHADADVVAYSSTIGSDIKLKKNVEDIGYGLDDVLKMRAVEFDWKEKRQGKHDIGVIAQELEKIIPEVVNEVKTIGEGAENGDTHKVVDYAKLTSVLIKAIQEQQVQIDELKTQIGE